MHLGRLNVGEGLHLGLVDDHDILLVDVLLVDVPARELLRLVHLLGGRELLALLQRSKDLVCCLAMTCVDGSCAVRLRL